MSLLAGEVQPALLVLLNSASGLSPLWTVREGSSPKSFVTVLDDGEYPADSSRTSAPKDPLAFDNSPLPKHADGRTDWTGRESQRASFHRPKHASRSIAGRVVHIQSPRPDTWIQAGSSRQALGVELPYVGVQFKRLGKRGLALEIVVEDQRGREGVVRLSSWKTAPSLHPEKAQLTLPLALPDDQHKLSDWAELSVDLRPLVALFGKLQAQGAREVGGQKRQRTRQLPEGFHCINYVRVYANCRVRRVWCSARPGVEFPLVSA